MNQLLTPLFLLAVKKRTSLIVAFKILFVLLVLFSLLGTWAIYTENTYLPFFYAQAVLFGQIGLTLYCVTLTPGIFRRFGIQNKLIQIIMLFRRYIGITVFLSVEIHYWFERGISLFLRGIFVWPAFFELFGMMAYSIFLAMFLTSNDLSTKKLGKWWKKIHSLTYFAVWLIFLHVFAQRLSIWSVLIGSTALLEVSSFVYAKYQRTKAAVAGRRTVIAYPQR